MISTASDKVLTPIRATAASAAAAMPEPGHSGHFCDELLKAAGEHGLRFGERRPGVADRIGRRFRRCRHDLPASVLRPRSAASKRLLPWAGCRGRLAGAAAAGSVSSAEASRRPGSRAARFGFASLISSLVRQPPFYCIAQSDGSIQSTAHQHVLCNAQSVAEKLAANSNIGEDRPAAGWSFAEAPTRRSPVLSSARNPPLPVPCRNHIAPRTAGSDDDDASGLQRAPGKKQRGALTPLQVFLYPDRDGCQAARLLGAHRGRGFRLACEN